MRAEELLAVGRPALLALLGQTQIEMPELVLPEVVTRLQSVPTPRGAIDSWQP